MGSVAVVIADVLLRMSDNSVYCTHCYRLRCKALLVQRLCSMRRLRIAKNIFVDEADKQACTNRHERIANLLGYH